MCALCVNGVLFQGGGVWCVVLGCVVLLLSLLFFFSRLSSFLVVQHAEGADAAVDPVARGHVRGRRELQLEDEVRRDTSRGQHAGARRDLVQRALVAVGGIGSVSEDGLEVDRRQRVEELARRRLLQHVVAPRRAVEEEAVDIDAAGDGGEL